MAALNRPAVTVALWAGHSPLVMAKHYLELPVGTQEGDSLDEAMGIEDLMELVPVDDRPASNAPRKLRAKRA